MSITKKQRPFITSLQDIFDAAGSSTKLAAKLDLHAFTVENWRRCGIPQKYWDILLELYDITPAELYAVSKNCRKSVTNPSKIARR